MSEKAGKPWLRTLLLVVLGGFSTLEAHENPSQPSTVPQEPLVVLRYDRIDVDHISKVITIKGRVALAHQGKQLFADTLTYHAKDDSLIASGHVRVHEPTGDIIFAESVHLKNHMSEGWVEQVRIMMADNARMAGLQGWKLNDQQHVMEHAVYSPCELCGEKRLPFWQMRAKRIFDDRITHDVSYRHVRLELGNGLPIFYSPYLRHVGPGVRRRSGFLVPTLVVSSQNGMGFLAPYYHTFSPQRDMTLTPIVTQRGGSLLGWEFRQRVAHGMFNLKGSVMQTLKQDQSSALRSQVRIRPWRGHLQGDLRYELNDQWLLSSQALLSSDQTYLRRYPFFGYTSDSFLTSSGTLEYFDRETYWGAKGYFFEPLASDTGLHSVPMIVPSIEYETSLEPTDRWTRRMSYNILNMKRLEGNQMARVSLRHDWTGHYLQSGLVWNPLFHVRVDGYHTRLVTAPNQVVSLASQYPFYGTALRTLPTLGVRVRWPLVAHHTHHQQALEPYMALLHTASWGPMGSRMPNEDNAHFDLTPVNVMQAHPFPGLDHVQTGTRLHYGISWSDHVSSGSFWGAEIGRIKPFSRSMFQLNAQDPPTFVPYTSYVGSLSYRSPQAHQGYARFQCHERSLRAERWEMGWFWTPSVYQFHARYAWGRSQIKPLSVPGFSTVLGSMKFPLGLPAWQGQVSSILNTEKGWKPLTQTAQVVYANDCFKSTFALNRTYYQDRDAKPNTSFFVTFFFKNLGAFSTQTLDSMMDTQKQPIPGL